MLYNIEVIRNNKPLIVESKDSEKLKKYIIENYDNIDGINMITEYEDSMNMSQREQECWELGFDEAYNELPTRRPIWNDDKLLNAYKLGYKAGERKRRLSKYEN